MLIAVDFDSTIARIMPPVLAMLNRRYKKNLTLKDVQEYPRAFERLNLKSEFFKCLSEVHQSHSLEFVDDYTIKALRWFDRHPDIDWYVLTGNPPDKLKPIEDFMHSYGFDVCIEWGALKNGHEWDVLIDDDPRVADFSRETIIIRQPWNEHLGTARTTKDWEGVIRKVEALL